MLPDPRLKTKQKADVMVHACNPSAEETGSAGLWSSPLSHPNLDRHRSVRDPVSETKCGWHPRDEQEPQTCAHGKCAREFVRVINDTVAPHIREE